MAERRPDGFDLEAALREVGGRIAYPPSADLLPAVRARIERERPRPWLLDLFRSPLSLAPAVATLVLLLLATLAFQPIAGTAAEALGLRGITLFRVPEAGPDRTPPRPFLTPDDIRVASVDEASREVGFTVRVPGELGAPQAVYVRKADRAALALLVYDASPAPSPSARVVLVPQPSGALLFGPGGPLLIMELRGSLETQLLAKGIPPGTIVEELTVNGGSGVWIEGEPHQFFYRAPNGDILPETVRLAGNVLLWEQDGLLMRIEAQIDREQALRIARSMR